jgi:copper(I)-binding protein
MRARSIICIGLLLAAAGLANPVAAAGKLKVEQAWFAPPPDAVALAGYAVLRNSGDAPVIVVARAARTRYGIDSETTETDGQRMQALDTSRDCSRASVSVRSKASI